MLRHSYAKLAVSNNIDKDELNLINLYKLTILRFYLIHIFEILIIKNY